jgi:hypothetical protein
VTLFPLVVVQVPGMVTFGVPMGHSQKRKELERRRARGEAVAVVSAFLAPDYGSWGFVARIGTMELPTWQGDSR